MFNLESGWGDMTADSAGGSLIWLHIEARHPSLLVILSTDPCRYRGHWVDGKMRPCIPSGCGYCEAHLGWQMRYVFAAHNLTLKISGLIEIGATAARVICDQQELDGVLRGQVFEFKKEGGRDRGKILIVHHHLMQMTSGLPAAMDVTAELRRMWGLPTS